MGKNDQIELKIQIPNGNWFTGVTHADFSYGSYVKIDGQKLTILRGNLIVTQEADVKTATIGLLCSDHIWYNITATTAAQPTTALEHTTTTKYTKKYIRNGQLIINYDNIEYNIQGTIIQ
jgi:hypothetical protein